MSRSEDVYDHVRYPVPVMECQRCGAVMHEYATETDDNGDEMVIYGDEECPNCGGPLQKGRNEETR